MPEHKLRMCPKWKCQCHTGAVCDESQQKQQCFTASGPSNFCATDPYGPFFKRTRWRWSRRVTGSELYIFSKIVKSLSSTSPLSECSHCDVMQCAQWSEFALFTGGYLKVLWRSNLPTVASSLVSSLCTTPHCPFTHDEFAFIAAPAAVL